ncbi:hypothetical protein RND81_14G091500 [Saponaria officinalis]|uniref:BZIP domain-containing protein n=1 Tax=Saponaria officinalis TaxID=3572 RepID=A0AAW1GNL8_SAPOF
MTSSVTSSQNQNSSSSEEMQMQMMDERKRKRMISNRESARRSRQRKQKHLDDLTTQVGNLRKSNGQILKAISVTTQQFLKVEAENSILRAQMLELSNRLHSLEEIKTVLGSPSQNSNNNIHGNLGGFGEEMLFPFVEENNLVMNPWNSVCMNQAIMAASADMFNY